VEAIKADLKKVAVAYQNAVVKIFDIESGKEQSRLPSDMSYGSLVYMAVSSVTSHLITFFLQMIHQQLKLTV
jgi:striatin 1/3/4